MGGMYSYGIYSVYIWLMYGMVYVYGINVFMYVWYECIE